MTETLSKAWSLFDAGNYTDAETLYKECYVFIFIQDNRFWEHLIFFQRDHNALVIHKNTPYRKKWKSN